jgi:hypothetical protein
MKVGELKNQMEEFRKELNTHFDLWRVSLDQPIPDFPVTNIPELTEQMSSLARKLGRLRPFVDRFASSTIMQVPAIGAQWDIFDSAVGNDVCQRKGPSLQAAIQQIDQILGQLDGMNEDKEVPDPHQPAAAPARNPAPETPTVVTQEKQQRIQAKDEYGQFKKKYERLRDVILIFLGLAAAILIGICWEYLARHYQWHWFLERYSVRLLFYLALLSLLEGVFVPGVRRHWRLWLGSILIPSVIALLQSLGG